MCPPATPAPWNPSSPPPCAPRRMPAQQSQVRDARPARQRAGVECERGSKMHLSRAAARQATVTFPATCTRESYRFSLSPPRHCRSPTGRKKTKTPKQNDPSFSMARRQQAIKIYAAASVMLVCAGGGHLRRLLCCTRWGAVPCTQWPRLHVPLFLTRVLHPQWLPAVAAIITVAACLCAVIIASNTGSAVHRASMMQIYAAQPAPLQMLDDEAGDEEEAELPLKESEEYDGERFSNSPGPCLRAGWFHD